MAMMMVADSEAERRVVTYARVSSEDQAERGTIRTQMDELERYLERQPDIALVRTYIDDGVNGTIPLAQRPAGSQLVRDAQRGLLDEVVVYKFDRIGRDAPDLLSLGRSLREAGVTLRSVVEGVPDLFIWDILAVISDNDRRTFLRRSADGMNRAAREARYTGGVVAYGYKVDGIKPEARLVPDVEPVWDGSSPAEVPTHASVDGRGTRRRATRAIWRSGRIRNLIVQPVYRGELSYGRRAKRPRQVITAAIEPLVSPELWESAQEALARHRVAARVTDRVYLLRGIMTCSLCGLSYVGSSNKGTVWYRCGGQIHERGAIDSRCPSRSIKGLMLEPLIWQDVERFLRDPGDLLTELDVVNGVDDGAAERERDLEAIEGRIAELDEQRRRAQNLAVRGAMRDDELDAELARIEADRADVERHRATLQPPLVTEVPLDADLLVQLRSRLDAGLSDQERQEIVSLLVGRITISTTVNDDGSKDAGVTIGYRFPTVLKTRTGTGSSLR